MSGKNLSIIGKRLPKIDAMAKCIGDTRYADDLHFSRMIYAKLLRSPHPHARIRTIQSERAANLDGVYAVITGKDLPEKFGILPVTQDEEALATEKVKYVGDPVAAVAAASETVNDWLRLSESVGPLSGKTIFAVGLTLFVFTLAMNVVAIRLVRKYREIYE